MSPGPQLPEEPPVPREQEPAEEIWREKRGSGPGVEHHHTAPRYPPEGIGVRDAHLGAEVERLPDPVGVVQGPHKEPLQADEFGRQAEGPAHPPPHYHLTPDLLPAAGSSSGASTESVEREPAWIWDAEEGFAEAASSGKPVMMDFWAEWCGPCKMLAPVIEEVAGKYSGRAKVGKVNVDQNPALSGKYGIRSIPTLIMFKDGNVVEQVIGVQSKQKIEELIEKYL